MHIEIRQLQPAQWEIWKNIRLRALIANPDSFGATYEEECALSDAYWHEQLTSQATAVFGLFSAERNLGCAGVTRFSGAKMAHKAKLWGVYIDPEYRGHGFGEMLVRACREYCEAIGIRSLLLAVNAENKGAIRLYEKLGFVVFGREPQALRQLNGDFVDDVLMVQNLRRDR